MCVCVCVCKSEPSSFRSHRVKNNFIADHVLEGGIYFPGWDSLPCRGSTGGVCVHAFVHVCVCFCSSGRSVLTSHTNTLFFWACPDGVCPVLCSRWAAGCNLVPWVLWMTPWMRRAASGRKQPYFGERKAVGTSSGRPSSHCARPCSHPMLQSPRSSREIGRTRFLLQLIFVHANVHCVNTLYNKQLSGSLHQYHCFSAVNR